MIKILLYIPSQELFEDISEALHSHGFWYEYVGNMNDLKEINKNQYDLIILYAQNKMDLVEYKNISFEEVPILLLQDSKESFLEENSIKNCVEVFFLPIRTSEFIQKLKNITRHFDYYERKYIIPGTSGSLKQYSFLDVLQAFMRKRYSGRLLLKEREYEGQIFFVNGIIDNAIWESFEGIEALDLMLFLDEADFEFIVEELKPTRKIKSEMNFIIFHLLERYSEIEFLLSQLPYRYENLVKNKEMEKDLEFLSPTLQQFYHSLPDLFSIMYLILKSKGNYLEALSNLQELIKQEYIIPESLAQPQEEEKGIKKFLNKIFRKSKEEEIEYEEYGDQYTFDHEHRKKLILQISIKDIKVLDKLIKI